MKVFEVYGECPVIMDMHKVTVEAKNEAEATEKGKAKLGGFFFIKKVVEVFNDVEEE